MAVAVLGQAACGEPDQNDRPHVLHSGSVDYTISCRSVPVNQLGRHVDVSDDDEEKFGEDYAVWGREILGVDPTDALAVRLAQNPCSSMAWVVALAESRNSTELPDELEPLLDE